jgi:Leucine-rich repeat (LRR) protein
VNQIVRSVWTLVKEAGITSNVKQIQLNEHLGLLELNRVMKMLEETEAALIELFLELGETIPEVKNLLNDEKSPLNAETIRAWMKNNPAELLTITVLKLNNLDLTVLPPEIGLLPNLEILNLKDNQLTMLPPEFGKLINLQELYLYGNPFPAMPPVFGKLINLKKFSLYDNRIRQQIDLHRLYLQNNQPTVQPLKEDLGLLELNRDMKMLEEAALIALFKELGKKIPKVRTLLKDRNFSLKAETIRAWMQGNSEKLLKVTELALNGLDLAVLPPEIGLMINLKKLSLAANQLTVLPPKIGQLINLQELNLCGTRLTVLPPEIGQLINLQKLSLAGNPLTALPPEFDQLVNLTLLILR